MKQKSRRLQVLSLALLAIAGLMAFMATGAQASEKAWLIEGNDIAANKLLSVARHTEFILKVPLETNLEILCLKVVGDDVLLISGTTTTTGTLLFSECKVFQNGAEKPSCNKKVVGEKVEGLLEPIEASGKGKLILHTDKKNYILFEPTVAGGSFAVIRFDPNCALPETNNVKGSLVAECAKLEGVKVVGVDCATEEKIHLLKPNEELFKEDKLTYGGKPATLSGVAETALTGADLNKTWAGHV